MAKNTHNRTQKETISALKEQVKLLNDKAKLAGKLSIAEVKTLNYLRSQLKERKSINKIDTNTLDNVFKARDIEAQITKNILKGGKSRELVANLQKQHISLINSALRGELDISDLESHREDILESINDISSSLTGKNVALKQELVQQLSEIKKQINAMNGLNEASQSIISLQEEQNDKYNEAFGWLTSINSKAKTYIEALKTTRGRLLLLKTAGVAIAAGVGKIAMDMKEFADESGLSYLQIAKLGPGIAFAKDEAKALMDEFGGLQNVTNKTLISMKLLSFQYGIGADSTARLLGTLESISSSSRNTLLSQIKTTAELARAEGVAPQAVMEDIAENTELFALYGKNGGKNLMKAAIQAKKLGLSMSTIASISDQLLDFESSIESQMEASVILGRNINLDKARQLAFSGDMVGLQKEILNMVGSESEFNRLDVVRRKALANAIGINVTELSKLVRNQEALNKNTQHYGSIISGIMIAAGSTFALVKSKGAALTEQVANATLAFEGFHKISKLAFGEKLLKNIINVGSAIFDLGKKVLISAGKFLLEAAMGIWSAFSKIPFGLGIPLAIGATAGLYATYKKFKSVDDVMIPPGGASAVTGPAGTFSLNPNDSVVAGTKLTKPTSKIDLSETNVLLSKIVQISAQLVDYNKKLLMQNERLLSGVDKRIKDLAIS